MGMKTCKSNINLCKPNMYVRQDLEHSLKYFQVRKGFKPKKANMQTNCFCCPHPLFRKGLISPNPQILWNISKLFIIFI